MFLIWILKLHMHKLCGYIFFSSSCPFHLYYAYHSISVQKQWDLIRETRSHTPAARYFCCCCCPLLYTPGLIITWDIFCEHNWRIFVVFLINYRSQIKVWFGSEVNQPFLFQVEHVHVRRGKSGSWRCEGIIDNANHQRVVHIITFTQQSNGQQPNTQLHVSSLCINLNVFGRTRCDMYDGEHQSVHFCLFFSTSFILL